MSILSKHTPTRFLYSDRRLPLMSRGFTLHSNDYLTAYGVTFGNTQIAYLGIVPVAVVKNHKIGNGYRIEGYRTQREKPSDPTHRSLEMQMDSIDAPYVSQKQLDEIIIEFIASEISEEINRRLTGE